MAQETEIMFGAIPAFLEPYLQADAMQRLKRVDMNCGVNYTSFPLFKRIHAYSRYTHSLHTALLAWRFTKDTVQTLACLFHDIATPAFAHTIDFLNGDYINQESTEEKTGEIIAADPLILSLLKEDHISIAAISDYHQYPLADNDSPHLSCDRLEYTLGNAYNYGYADLLELKGIVEDIVPNKNELVFKNKEPAHRLGLLSIACGKIYACDADRYSMELLARLLKKALQAEVITMPDLYTDEDNVIAKLKASFLAKEWEKYCALHQIYRYDHEVPHSVQVETKKRYIDPSIKDAGRLHEIDEEYRDALKSFLEESQKVWLKGE